MLKNTSLRYLLLLITILMLVGCNSNFKTKTESFALIPSTYTDIIKINSLNEFISNYKANTIYNALRPKQNLDAIKILNYLNPKGELYLAFNNNDFFIATQNDSTLLSNDSLLSFKWSAQKNKIHKVIIDSSVTYYKLDESSFLASNNREAFNLNVEDKDVTELKQLIETTDPEAMVSLIIKGKSPEIDKLIFLDSLFEKQTKQYKVLDIAFDENSFSYNGVITSNDTVSDFLNSFKKTIPQKNHSLRIAPSNTTHFISLTFGDYPTFSQNVFRINKLKTDTSANNFLRYANEISKIETDNNEAISIHVLDTNLALDYIEDKSFLESYRNVNLYTFGHNNFFHNRLHPFMSMENSKFLAIYEDFVIITNSLDYLKNIISSSLSNNTLSNSARYKSIEQHLTDESSLLLYKNESVLSETLNADLKEYDSNFLQMTYENGFAHINGIIQKYKTPAAADEIKEIFSTPLDHEILSVPHMVKNHINGTNEIVVQDIENNLYLISNSGHILWKKPLTGEILGTIDQVDMYKNGRLQLAFTTPNRVYIIDRNGNDVSPFPLKLKDRITQPLSVFDYDNNKNYRLMVTQGNSLLLYTIKGKLVSGFNYKKVDKSIITQPKHFRLGNKDYIVFLTEKQLKIIDRRGSTRVNIKQQVNGSGNEVFLYKNRFVTSNSNGQLVMVDTKGNVSNTNLNVSNKHKLVTTSKTLVVLDENKLSIKSKSSDLDFGEYTQPSIFYLNDKIYVSVTDLQSKKVYLFDSQSNPIPNFPVYGNSAIDLKVSKQKNKLEFVVKGDSNLVMLYQIN